MHDNQLKGSRKDVYFKIKELLDEELSISIMALSQTTYWSPSTIFRALKDLRKWGLIDYEPQSRPGAPVKYQIVEEL